MSSSYFDEEAEPVETATEPAEPAVVSSRAKPEAAPDKRSEPKTSQTKNQKIVSGNPEDPIIQFLNSEIFESELDDIASEKKPKSARRIQPPRKPRHPGLSAPKKPFPGANKPAPNAPEKVKAPTKPKKRLYFKV